MRVKDVMDLDSLLDKQENLAKTKRVNVEIAQIALKDSYKVESTMNYNMFHLMESNREIEHEKIIALCMIKVGFLPIPIIVNELNEIADGQGRYEACKKLGYPIYYMVVPGLRIDHVRRINYAMTRWRMDNYVESYGNDVVDYAYLNNLKIQFPRYSIKVLDVAGGGSISGGGITQKIKSGTYKMTPSQYDDAVRILKWLDSFSDYFNNKSIIGGRLECLYMAMIFAYRDPSVSKKRLTSAFRTFSSRTDRQEMSLLHVGDIRDCLKRLENMYNYGISKLSNVNLINDYEMAIRREGRKK